MNCPDIERLLEFALDGVPDPELAAHLRECLTCASDVTFARSARSSYREEAAATEASLQRAIHAARSEIAKEKTEGAAVASTGAWDLVSMGLLGSATFALALGAAGDVGSGGAPLFGMIVAAGLASAAREFRQQRREIASR